MTPLTALWTKIYRKGVLGNLRWFYRHAIRQQWDLVWLQHPLHNLPPERTVSSGRTERIRAELLPAFERYFPQHQHIVSDFVQQGLTGLVHLDHDNHAIAFVWLAAGDYYDQHVYHCWLRVPPGSAYLVYGEIAPHQRRSGKAILLNQAFQLCKQLGYTELRAVVEAGNRPSLSLCMALGFNEAGEILQVTRWFRRLYRTSSKTYTPPRFAHVVRHNHRRLQHASPPAQSHPQPQTDLL